MSNLDEIAQKNNYKGIAISIAIHVILLLLFLWLTVWQEPYPPNPEYGIELNFGTVDTGSGQEVVAAEETTDAIEEELSQESTEEAVEEESSSPSEEATDSQETSENETVSDSQAVDTEPVQEEGLVEQEVKAATTENKEQTEEKKTAAKVAEEVKEEIKQTPKTNPNALFPGNNKSQGETNTADGDQGQENGSVDASAMMGPQGGGSGSKLEMSGWAWDSPPKPNDQSDQNGQIVFRIKVDDNGEVINVDVVETTVSPDIVRIYQNEVEKLTFYKTSAGKTLNAYTGKITFLIRSR